MSKQQETRKWQSVKQSIVETWNQCELNEDNLMKIDVKWKKRKHVEEIIDRLKRVDDNESDKFDLTTTCRHEKKLKKIKRYY